MPTRMLRSLPARNDFHIRERHERIGERIRILGRK
jgi:hypothetical protein